MKKLIVVLLTLALATGAFGVSTVIELTPENSRNWGVEISVEPSRFNTIRFDVKWNGLLQIPIDRTYPKKYSYLDRENQKRIKVIDTKDTVVAIPFGCYCELELRSDSNIVIASLPVAASGYKDPGFSFGVVKEYLGNSIFHIRCFSKKPDMPSMSEYWFNLGKMYRELNKDNGEGDE